MPASGFEAGLASAAAGGSEFDEEALPAFESAAASGAATLLTAPAGDDDGPPLEALEAQMRGEIASREGSAAATPSARRAAASAAEDEEEGAGSKSAPLPELDALVARIPAEVRETLDELFRARFTAVKKLPKKAFQAATTKAPPARPGAT